MQRLEVINDFVAQAMAITRLAPRDAINIKSGRPQPGGSKLVLGAGTGLGVAILADTAFGFRPIAGEGGHVSLPADNADELAILAELHKHHGHASAETVLSGAGLSRLHSAMRALAGSEAQPLDAETISERALAGDFACSATLTQFCRFLASVAANAALTAGATAGVYLTGGIAPRIQAFINCDDFRQRFVERGKQNNYLASVPITLVDHPNPALLGAAAYLNAQLTAEERNAAALSA